MKNVEQMLESELVNLAREVCAEIYKRFYAQTSDKKDTHLIEVSETLIAVSAQHGGVCISHASDFSDVSSDYSETKAEQAKLGALLATDALTWRDKESGTIREFEERKNK